MIMSEKTTVDFSIFLWILVTICLVNCFIVVSFSVHYVVFFKFFLSSREPTSCILVGMHFS